MKLREWNARLHGLVVFRSLLDDPVVAKLLDLTDRMEAGAPGYGPVCDAVAQFEAALFEHTTNWGSYLSAAVLEAETVCVRQAASGTLAPALQTALDSELPILPGFQGIPLAEPQSLHGGQALFPVCAEFLMLRTSLLPVSLCSYIHLLRIKNIPQRVSHQVEGCYQDHDRDTRHDHLGRIAGEDIFCLI